MNMEMSHAIKHKLDNLKKILGETEGCAIAFSGGVDSTLLVTVAYEVLGERCLAVLATSSTYPERECKRAIEWLETKKIPFVVIASEELDIPEFSKNPVNRCYHCKKELFEKVREQALKRGLESVADGSNADDKHDYRPGMTAARETRVLSPLAQAGLTKEDIRTLSRDVYHLSTADKPSMACLASRFPYGSTITREKLSQVEKIEAFLEERGFRIYRARHHGEIVRLELGEKEFESCMHPDLRKNITDFAKAQGFAYVALDLEGYRTGSMNEGLQEAVKNTRAG